MPLSNYYSVACLKILQRIGLNKKLHINDDGNVLNFIGSIPFLHPYQNVPPTNPINDQHLSSWRIQFYSMRINAECSISHIHRWFFRISMQVYCKNLWQNNVVVIVDGSGKFFTKAKFLHNTKVTPSKWVKINIERNIKTSINKYV